MSHYTRRFDKPDRKQNDADALQECRDYLGPKAWEAVLFEAGRADGYDAANGGHAGWVMMTRALAFCGVRGYPVHAIGRAYCLEGYRSWMADGKDAVATDAEGFPIEAKTDGQ